MIAIRPSKKSSPPMISIRQPAKPIQPVQRVSLAMVPLCLPVVAWPRADSLDLADLLPGLTSSRYRPMVSVPGAARQVVVTGYSREGLHGPEEATPAQVDRGVVA